MELELKQTPLTGYELVLDASAGREETAEAIVPDACPDILRIVDTEAQAFLERKESGEGRAAVSGSVRASVLYLPDGEEGVRCMELTIPFSWSLDSAKVSEDCALTVSLGVQSAESRALNPRKILTRVNLLLTLRAWAPVAERVCSGVEESGETGVEQRLETISFYPAVAVEEKPFTLSDELSLPGGKGGAEELLKTRASIICREAKLIGAKLIFKGEAAIQAVCRRETGEVSVSDVLLPFSQIMEVTQAGEEAGCGVQLVLTHLDCALTQGGTALSVSAGLLAQAVVREERSLTLLTDAYSTRFPAESVRRDYAFHRLLSEQTCPQNVREVLETGALARSVLDAHASVGPLRAEREGNTLALTAEVCLCALCAEEDGGITQAARTIPVSCRMELPGEAVCLCACRAPEPVFASPTAGGVEARLELEFSCQAFAPVRASGISALRLDTDHPRDDAAAPSVILRTVGEGEQLWDVAKACSAAPGDILRANALESETLPAGQLLLIPGRR